jgi:hypothetical protein
MFYFLYTTDEHFLLARDPIICMIAHIKTAQTGAGRPYENSRMRDLSTTTGRIVD